jgi:hypothetical protein
MTTFLRAFRDHPASVGETYWGHMAFALWFAGQLGAAAGAALIHALIPPLFETTASRIIQNLHAVLTQRH